MKITKAMGMAALKSMVECAVNKYGFFDSGDACDAIEELGWLSGNDADYFTEVTKRGDLNREEVLTALAMCAAIAGVRPD